DRVDPLLAPEVLVDDGLGHLGARRDLLDARALEPLLREQAAAHGEQLLAPLARGHAGTGGASGLGHEDHHAVKPRRAGDAARRRAPGRRAPGPRRTRPPGVVRATPRRGCGWDETDASVAAQGDRPGRLFPDP